MEVLGITALAVCYLIVGFGVSTVTAKYFELREDEDKLALGAIALFWPLYSAVALTIALAAGIGWLVERAVVKRDW